MAVRLNIATVYKMIATQALTVTGNEDVLWPLHADPEFPKAPSTAKHWLFFTALKLTPRPRASTDSADVYDLALEGTLVTINPRESALYAHPTQLQAVLAALAETSWDAGDGAHQHRIETGKAGTEMRERENVNGRGMSSDFIITGIAQRIAGTN